MSSITLKYKNAYIHVSDLSGSEVVKINWPDYSLTEVSSVQAAKVRITRVEHLLELTRRRANADFIYKKIDRLKGLKK